jgi:hypothetical protein
MYPKFLITEVDLPSSVVGSISEIENAVHYCSEGKHPICKQCYDKHVSIRDLSFVPKNV